jgi:DNA-binding transcriptional LysR family regulator
LRGDHQLQRGDVDLILTNPRPRQPGQAGWKLLTDERLELAVPPGHRLAIAAQNATRPLGLAWITGRQLPGMAEAFRGWLISSAPRSW